MSSFKLRPRTKVELNKSIEEISNDFKTAIENSTKIVGTVAKQFIILKIKKEDRHFWSPQLTIMVEENPDGVTLSGLYGPKQSIWAMFAFTYGVLGMLITAFAIWGAVEVQLYDDPTMFYFIPIIIILGIVAYIIAQLGQKIGAEQMYDLHHFFQEITNTDVHVN